MSDSFAEIRELVAKRKTEILSEINNKKSVGKKQCQQWIEELCDLVIDYHPILSMATTPSMQPTVKLVSIESTDDFKRFTTSVSSVKENESSGVEPEVIPVLDVSDTEDDPPKDSVRYKGVIRGLDSIQRYDNWDDDWNPTEPPKSPTKKSKSSRQTRSKTSKAKESDEKSTTVESNEWSSEGKVLGGNTQSETQAVTHEDMRRLLAEKTEQRLAQMTTRGAKGEVKLPMSAPKDRGDTLIPLRNKPLLQWKI